VEAAVRKSMLKVDSACNIVPIWGSTLHHIDDLPYDPHTYFPHTYGYMKKKQVDIRVRELLSSAESGSMPFIDLGKAPDVVQEAAEYVPHLVTDLGLDPEEVKASALHDKRGCYKF